MIQERSICIAHLRSWDKALLSVVVQDCEFNFLPFCLKIVSAQCFHHKEFDALICDRFSLQVEVEFTFRWYEVSFQLPCDFLY